MPTPATAESSCSRLTPTPTARRLTEKEAARVVAYLNDEGTLGDFVYGGGMEE